MVNAVAIFALSLYNLALAQPSGTQCPPVAGKPSCACQPPGEAIIDLSDLSNSDGTPRYFEYRDSCMDTTIYLVVATCTKLMLQ